MKKKGYFGIGVYKPKTSENIGTLWRSAYQFGASFIFTIDAIYKSQPSDIYKSYRHIPLIQFKNLETFQNSVFYDCQLICVDFGENSVNLKEFKHPQRAIYLLGAEKGGLPEKLLKTHQLLEIPYKKQPSLNVAVAGSIVMYDRMIKE